MCTDRHFLFSTKSYLFVTTCNGLALLHVRLANKNAFLFCAVTRVERLYNAMEQNKKQKTEDVAKIGDRQGIVCSHDFVNARYLFVPFSFNISPPACTCEP